MKPSKTSIKQPNLATKVIELQDKLNRSLADYINLEKRIERDKDFIASFATASVINHMVDVLDDFLLAQSHLKDSGLQMAIDKFKTVLSKHGLVEINPKDLPFDPETMECVQVVDGPENTVVDVRKIGYSLNGQTVRPAQVAVGKAKN